MEEDGGRRTRRNDARVESGAVGVASGGGATMAGIGGPAVAGWASWRRVASCADVGDRRRLHLRAGVIRVAPPHLLARHDPAKLHLESNCSGKRVALRIHRGVVDVRGQVKRDQSPTFPPAPPTRLWAFDAAAPALGSECERIRSMRTLRAVRLSFLGGQHAMHAGGGGAKHTPRLCCVHVVFGSRRMER